MGKKEFLKSVIYNRNSYLYWSLKVTEILKQRSTEELLLCEDYNDLTSPSSKKIPDIHIAVSLVYDTIEKLFLSIRVHIV